MADRPILFSGPMVRALLAGTKTQTRRTMNPQPELQMNGFFHVHNRHGGVVNVAEEDVGAQAVDYLRIADGDRLYVREHWFTWGIFDDLAPSRLTGREGISYIVDNGDGPRPGRFRQGMHMPRWASRLTLTVTDVRVERLQDITEPDAQAEGADGYSMDEEGIHTDGFASNYRRIWEAINGSGSWDSNPWVAAYTFTVQRGNIDQLVQA